MLKINRIWLFALIIFVSHQLFAQDKGQKIDELAQKYFELGQFNGSLLVADNGSVIFSKGYGYADMENKIPNQPNTKFRLASVTKQFTAALIMQLVEKGKINLNGKLSEYLPYYRKDVGEKITIHQILSHTAGLTNHTDSKELMNDRINTKVNPKEFVLKYCSDDLVSEPGTKWAYSNSGYFILGAVIEEITGKKYEEVLNENILLPLEMNNSGMESSDQTYENFAKGYQSLFGEYKPAKQIEMSIPYAAGSMYSNVEDMFKWDRALYTEKILKKESLDAMFTAVMNNYGYGWHIGEQQIGDSKKKAVMHSGGIFGFNSIEVRMIDDKHYIMILNNVENGNINQLSIGIANILYGLEPPKPKQSLALTLSKLIKDKPVKDAIAEINTLRENKEEYRAIEREFNMLGYILLQNGKINDAIEVFKLNVQYYPESGNVYDSLGEAYAEAGDKENAILNYKKSIEIDPGNVGAKEKIKILEGK